MLGDEVVFRASFDEREKLQEAYRTRWAGALKWLVAVFGRVMERNGQRAQGNAGPGTRRVAAAVANRELLNEKQQRGQ